MSFSMKSREKFVIALIFAGAIGLSFVAHATIQLENWLVWGIIYPIIPLALTWVLVSLVDEPEDPYDYIEPLTDSRSSKSKVTDDFLAIVLMLAWPVLVCIAIFLIALIFSASTAGKIKHISA